MFIASLSLFDTSGFVPRWYCGDWSTALGWTHILSDLAIWSAYMAIPILLAWFVTRRRDMPFAWVFWLFCLFIFACGTTHLLEAIIFWDPVYRLAAVVKVVTALVSWATVMALVPVVPKLLSLRSPAELEREIADRKRIEERMRASEALFRSSFENAAIGIGLSGLDGQWQQVNPALCELVGYSEAELLAKTFEEITHPDDRPAQQRLVEKLLGGELRSYQLEKRYLHKQGGVVWVLISVSLLRDDAGRPQCFIKQVQDISHRKHVEESLRLQSRIIDQSPDAVVSTTLDGHITSWNRGAAQTYGRSAEQVIGRPFTSLEGRQPMADALLRAIPLVLKNGMHEFESRLADADGRETIIQSRLSLLRDERQNPVGIINHSIDITTRRQLETKLQQAQKLESLGVLAGGVAHDFNNLLMGVLGHAELALLSMPPGAPGRQSLEHIRTAALRAADLCRQMLAYSGKGRFIVQPIDLARMVEEMTHLLEVPISKKATLRYEFAPYLPAFEADPTQIRQVVMNLITNAAEAIEGDDGEIVVRTSVAEVDAARPDHDWLPEALLPGRYVSLEVSDNGCGMDAETKRKIFDPFFSTKFTGRGLGLAAVIGIVRGHHGGLQVRSEKGCGTTFRILFPCSTTQATSAPSEPAVANGWSGAGTVLVADDDPEVRLVVSELLERLGFKFLLACDGVEAVEVFRREADRLRLVLLDLTMPRLDGNQALKQMAEIRSEIPVVVISGYSEQDTVLRISGRQLAGFIQKPFQSSALISKLREVLDSHPLTNPNSD